MLKKSFLIATLMTVGLVLATPSAQAAPIVFNLDTSAVFGNLQLGTVTLELMTSGPFAGQIKIDVAVGGSGRTFKIIDTGTHEAFSFNTTIAGPYNASTFTMGGFVPNYPFSANYNPSTNPQFGKFDMALNSTCTNPGSCQPSISGFTFYVGHSGGFTNVNQLVDLTSTPQYAYFAVDVLCLTGCSGSGMTGVIGALTQQPPPPPPPQLPEPASLLLLGIGLTAVGLAKRKFTN